MTTPVSRNPLVIASGFIREVNAGDIVNTVDAAELTTLTVLPFTVTTSGDNTLFTPPAGKKVRVRRIMPILSDPDGTTNPLLILRIGAVEFARGFAISGRLNFTGSNAGDALILNLSKNGNVSGTIYYDLV